MSELNRRILSTLILIAIALFSLFNDYILTLILLILFTEIYNEIFLILRRIIKRKIQLYFSLLFSLFYLSVLIILTWLIFADNLLQFKLYFLGIVLICVTSDIGGYVFGKIIGGKKLTKISPNKTYSGLIGSYLFTLITFIYFYYQFNYPLNFIFVALFVSTISQIGDLFVSYIKRRANVKDTGYFLPGHGGILDRVDGIIFAIPISINFHFIFI